MAGTEPTDGLTDETGSFGQEPESATTTPEATTPDSSAVLDPSLYGDYLVPVKINGRDEYVPFSSVRDGLMMQGDYTQKTQQLAAERERLAQAERLMIAFENDPHATLSAMSQAFGWNPDGQDGSLEDPEDIDPEEARLQQIESFMAAQQQRELDNHIQNELALLKQTHGEFDDGKLIDFMVRNNLTDFNLAYGAYAFQESQKRQQVDQQATSAKQALPPVRGGHGVQAGAVVQGAHQAPRSIADAWEQSKRELGLT